MPAEVHRLPLLRGAEHLGFRCNGCAECCRSLRVPVTHHDLRRLTGALAQPALECVEWLPPDAVDMTGEPGSFVELGAGRRLMVLRHASGACHLLDAAGRCRAYAARPQDCRLFPFDIERDAEGQVVRLSRLDPSGCGDENGPRVELAELARADGQRWAELADYQSRLGRWNRLARHRRRFGKPLGDAAAFLAFLGF